MSIGGDVGGDVAETIIKGSSDVVLNLYGGAPPAPGHEARPAFTQLPPPRPPPPIPGFLGREKELAVLRAELRPGGGAWLHGPPGCGLTALLRQAANAPEVAALPAGVVYLKGQDDRSTLDDVVLRLYARCFASDAAIQLSPELARVAISRLQALFVLDGVPLAWTDLHELTLLFGRGAVLVAADGSASDSLLDVPLGGLTLDQARRLFLREARQAGEAQPDQIAWLNLVCNGLANLPLPLVLAGRLYGELGPGSREALIELAKESIDGRTALARAVRICLAALDDDERMVLAALAGAGRSGLDLATLAQVSTLSALDLANALSRLTRLRMLNCDSKRCVISWRCLRQTLQSVLRR
jgi:hypothetical protein